MHEYILLISATLLKTVKKIMYCLHPPKEASNRKRIKRVRSEELGVRSEELGVRS
jgi:hypothetical protein